MSEWKMAERLRDLDKLIQEKRDELDWVEMELTDEPDFDRSDYLRLLGHLNDYRAMLSAAPLTTADATPSPQALKRVADLKIKLDIPDRYACEVTQRISADQWRRICQILEEPAPTHIGREG